GGARCYKGGEYNNCTINGNIAEAGGGIHYYQGGVVNNCAINNNTSEAGGGIYCYKGGEANNCAVAMNDALFGGGVYCNEGGILESCTISDNNAFAGGGVVCDEGGSLKNTIIFSNTALEFNNWVNYETGMSYAYCCTTPDPGGTGNITNNPVLVNFAHISTNSPCIGLGDNSAVTGMDIDGDAWLNPPAIGCDQPTLAGLTGTLSVVVYAEMTNLTAGAQCRFTGYVEGMADIIFWSFGESATETNLGYATSYAWNTPGEYPVILTAFNSDNPGGVAGTVTVYVVSESTHYVDPGNAAPSSPYLTWATAATNIQDAIDACFLGGKVFVTNGIYATGMSATPKLNMPNRVVLTKNIPVESVNGPDATYILGSPDPLTGGNGTNAVRCIYMSAGS
ncbi:MAG: PKD domain-containing protein, partial [Planctomycetes bacterium]|nr:PKD domain-containing protein [Planctomycetota bacterium]